MSLGDAALARLTTAQLAAWRHVEMSVRKQLSNARSAVATILGSCGCPVTLYDAAADSIRRHARVIVHFHPDRIGLKPVTVAEALLDDGQYRGQFETGLSSGSLTAFAGGARDTWEKELFGGAYHRAGASIHERPKYGALELIRYPDGPWPRFGSCYLVLSQEVSWRASFTFSGSEKADAAERMGTIAEIECVLVALLREVASGARAQVLWPPFVVPTLGVEGLTVPGLLERLASDLALPRTNPSGGPPGRVLDTGIEAQVHGPIELERDVERLVVDPAFVGTRTGDYLNDLAQKYAIPLDWHGGFCLAAGAVPAEFRGPAIQNSHGESSATGWLTPRCLGPLSDHCDFDQTNGKHGQTPRTQSSTSSSCGTSWCTTGRRRATHEGSRFPDGRCLTADSWPKIGRGPGLIDTIGNSPLG